MMFRTGLVEGVKPRNPFFELLEASNRGAAAEMCNLPGRPNIAGAYQEDTYVVRQLDR